MWPMGLLFLITSAVKQYSYENDFSGVCDALHQSFLVYLCFTTDRSHAVVRVLFFMVLSCQATEHFMVW